MNRDLAVPLLLLLLLVLAGSLSLSAFLPGALVLAAFFALLVVPWLEQSGPLRVLAILVAAGPFLAYGLLASPRPPDTLLLPGIGVFVVGAAAVVVAMLPRRAGRIVAVVLLGLIAGDLLLGRAGLPLLPEGFNPVRDPVARVGGVGESKPAPVPEPFEGRWPRGDRLVAIAEPFTPPAWEGQEVDGATLIGWPYAANADPVLLDPLAGVVVISETFEPDWWALASEPLASYVRRGGLLVGPPPGRDWPEPLGRHLGAAGGARAAGPDGARRFGLGLVLRAGSEGEIRAALAWGLEQPLLHTVFDDAVRALPLPEALEGWRDDPDSRGPQRLLLLVYALVALALDRILRGRGPRLIGLVAPALALGLALAWTGARDPGVRAHALALDLGGGGGRRVEALALQAGPEGWAGAVEWAGGGHARVLGGRVDREGRIVLGPSRTAWALRESVSAGAGEPIRPDPEAAFLTRLLRGPVGSHRVELGRGGMLPASLDGVDLPAAWVLRLR